MLIEETSTNQENYKEPSVGELLFLMLVTGVEEFFLTNGKGFYSIHDIQ